MKCKSSIQFQGIPTNKYATKESVHEMIEDLGDTIEALMNHAKISGITDPYQAKVSFVDTDRDSVQIAPVQDSFSYIINGNIVKITDPKIVSLEDIGDGNHQNGFHYIYFADESGTLQVSTELWNIEEVCPVAAVLWNQNNKLGRRSLLANELHSSAYSTLMHKNAHFTRGTQLVAGGNIGGYTIGEPTTEALTFSVENSTIADEDIFITIHELIDGNGRGANYTVFYRDANGDWKWEHHKNHPFINKLDGKIFRNTTKGLVECDDYKYINSYLFLTNFLGEARHSIILSPNQYSKDVEAYSECLKELDFKYLPFTEFIGIKKITFEVSDIYTNTGKCVIDKVQDTKYSNVHFKQ